jgi:hypothetical protein
MAVFRDLCVGFECQFSEYKLTPYCFGTTEIGPDFKRIFPILSDAKNLCSINARPITLSKAQGESTLGCLCAKKSYPHNDMLLSLLKTHVLL